jgi:hypothetical protein
VLGAVVCRPAIHAHHTGHELSTPSPKCGWVETEALRDRSHVTDFCAQAVPVELQISSASAVRERLWIEAPADLASTLRGDVRSTAALLQTWLQQWRTITGYRTATVTLMHQHIEFARVQTTMTGDVVTIR